MTSVTSCGLKFFRLNATLLKVPLHSVLISFARVALLSLASLKLPIQQLTGHAMVIHPDNMSHPSQLGLNKYGFNAATFCMVQNLKVCDTVLPSDAKYGMEGTHMRVLQLFNMPVVQSPSLSSIQERGQDCSFVDFQLCRKANACSLPKAWLALLILDVISLSRDPSFEMAMLPRYLKLSIFASGMLSKRTFGSMGVVFGAGWCSTSVLLRLMVRPMAFDASENLLSIICRSLSLCARRAQSSAKRAS